MNFLLQIRSGYGGRRDPIVHTIPFSAGPGEDAREKGHALFETWKAETRFPGRTGQNTTLRYVPSEGDGANFGVNGDAYPCTVLSVSATGHTVVVRQDRATVLKGHGGPSEGAKPALFEVDPHGAERTFTRRPDGSYREKGCKYTTLRAGRATAYNPHV